MTEVKNPILYVVLNGELNMSPGKAAAQTAHAVAMLKNTGNMHNFTDEYKRTVIVLEAKDSETIKNLHEYLKTAGIYSQYYIDERSEGSWDERELFNVTALAAVPIYSEDTEARSIFSDFPLFGFKKDIWSRVAASFHK